MIRKTDDVIIKTLSRIIIPFIQIYALYVIIHGHYSPGGGFQGGVILGASIVLLFLTHGLSNKSKIISDTGIKIFTSIGLFIYAGIGLTCVLMFGNYLDYSKLSHILNVDPSTARSLCILAVEIGVSLTVMAVMVSIFVTISTTGENSDEVEK